MKISNLLFVTATALVLGGQAQAQIIPSFDEGPAKCHQWAENYKDNTAYYNAAKKRCTDHETCMVEQSSNENELRECAYEADERFIRAVGGMPTRNVQEVSHGMDTPVTTEAPESDYYHPERDKGFDFSKQE